MKSCLQFLAVLAVLAISTPASGQYLFLDANGDGHNSGNPAEPGSGSDGLTPSVTSIDIYYDTNHNFDGSATVCDQTASNPLTIRSYEVILGACCTGTVTFNGWTDNMGFATGLIPLGDHKFSTSTFVGPEGSEAWIGVGSDTYLPAGRYKIGTLGVTVTGNPVLYFRTAGLGSMTAARTDFGTQCEGIDLDYIYKLGVDIPQNAAFGTPIPSAVKETTWGKIKQQYH